MTQKEKLLPELAEEGWLAHVPGQHGKYSMGVSMPGTQWSNPLQQAHINKSDFNRICSVCHAPF